jgi:hypothetical protein
MSYHYRAMLNSIRLAAAVLALAIVAPAQTTYTPQFKGDPAHSTAEAVALGYMRNLNRAQFLYKKKHGAYATTLQGLVNTGSFTRRMVKPERGDYTVQFHCTGKDYWLEMVPKQFDADHRAFFSDDSGVIRVESDKPATASSPKLKAD